MPTPFEQAGIRERLAATLPGASPLIALVLAGRGATATGFGLVSRVLAAAPESPRAAASARAEILCGGAALERSDLSALATAAENTTGALIDAGDSQRTSSCATGERLLSEIQAGELAHYSSVLRTGLQRRQIVLAERIQEGAVSLDLEDAVVKVCEHKLAEAQGASEHADLALKLMRWLVAEAAGAESVRGAAESYAT